ncbi:MAG: glutamate racemase [Cyanobacteriota bacterium]
MKEPIGIFDSGVGGLTVIKELNRFLPNENIVYFGDIARVPYGSKTPEEILSIVREIIDWMLSFNVKAVAMACNTSSALALDTVRREYDIPIFGLIKPTANYIYYLENKPKKVGVIATQATVKSKAYSKEIKKLLPDVEVIEIACPGLVEIIESGQIKSKVAYREVEKFIKPLIKEKVDKIILGCTHYPFVSDLINEIYPKEKLLINPAEYMVREIMAVLESLGINNIFNPSPVKQYYVSALPLQFIKVGNKLLKDELTEKDVKVQLLGDKSLYTNMAV